MDWKEAPSQDQYCQLIDSTKSLFLHQGIDEPNGFLKLLETRYVELMEALMKAEFDFDTDQELNLERIIRATGFNP